jgi:hypothetical protein
VGGLAVLARLGRVGFFRLAADDFDNHVARLQPLRFVFPKTIGLAAAIETQAATATAAEIAANTPSIAHRPSFSNPRPCMAPRAARDKGREID